MILNDVYVKDSEIQTMLFVELTSSCPSHALVKCIEGDKVRIPCTEVEYHQAVVSLESTRNFKTIGGEPK